jgi:DNA primase
VSAAELVKIAEKGGSLPTEVAAPIQQAPEGAGFVALSLLIHEWDSIAPWLIEDLFLDAASRGAFVALAEADGDVHRALEVASPDAAAIIERAAVYDGEADAFVEARALIGAAVRRELQAGRSVSDAAEMQQQRAVRIALEDLAHPEKAISSAVQLLQWLSSLRETLE